MGGCVVNLVGHGSCIMGHGSVFVWVSGQWQWPVTHCLLWTAVRTTYVASGSVDKSDESSV